ncbi:hypothetical protein SDRG_11660 [Saprolegnia diclina VS20]|uniref:Uncharacterized protein n=1 Tax=Saprolegnia diclina (strain VS20) TaxID=1156394 RepID=T0QAQ7_SAPDV|nr:hypothetical protein SDRG_11660 [Saprolegnia diclina VS20]EQC30605.1 hypothetical protein SDRG_11660 [Saprolegnia diclina VS20]|eukprot:XP_008615931.1 hypothetical protein SDRG_11660 [Saprolegnia diclina VS20]
MALLDGTLWRRVLDRYFDCVGRQCDALSRSDAPYLAITAQYTSCITSCAAAETIATTNDIRDELTAIAALGYDELASVRRYLAGDDDAWPASHPAVYAENARVLPTDYFVPWESLLVPIPVGSLQLWTTATAYLEACVGHRKDQEICDAPTVQTVLRASRRVSIVAPHMAPFAPPGHPNTVLNPLAHVGPRHVCVASHGSLQLYKLWGADNDCAPDVVDGGLPVEYRRHQLPPNVWTLGPMEANGTEWPAPAAYTYCGTEQYAAYLERELFGDCAMAPASLQCFVSLWSRRADCMASVLNVHLLLSHRPNAFVATIGQSAGVLTGFYRCEHDISRASIARGAPNALTTSSLLLQRHVSGLSFTVCMGGSLLLLALLFAVQRSRRRPVDENDVYLALL